MSLVPCNNDTAIGICFYCKQPLENSGDTTEFYFNGLLHRVHDSCWNALEVEQRLRGGKTMEAFGVTKKEWLTKID